MRQALTAVPPCSFLNINNFIEHCIRQRYSATMMDTDKINHYTEVFENRKKECCLKYRKNPRSPILTLSVTTDSLLMSSSAPIGIGKIPRHRMPAFLRVSKANNVPLL